MKKNQSKYFYTASLMNEALILLLEKKDIEFITVTEIAKKAGVNRSTFYLHYDDIYDLLAETIENLNKNFLSSFCFETPLKITNKEDAFLITSDFLIPYLNFCKKNKHILKIVYQKPHLFKAKNIYQRLYKTIFYPAISKFLDQEDDKVYSLEFFTQGVSAIIRKWISLDCITEIERIIEIIKKCIRYEN